MSTKIYDAYKLSGKYDIVSLNTALSDLRQQVTKQCENIIANIVVRQFLSMYYMTLLHGKNTPADTDTVTTNVLEKIARQDMKSAWAYLYCKITSEISDLSNTTRPFSYNFYNNLLLFPLKDKILAMYFGNTDIRKFIENHEIFEDYHYQNQCDKPDDISDEEWDKRESDWNDAIGPDYIPANHGWQVRLFNTENIMPIFNPNRIDTIMFPTDENMTKILAKTFDKSMAEEEINKIIKTKISFIHTKEDFCKLFE